jgi:hypothetical protein
LAPIYRTISVPSRLKTAASKFTLNASPFGFDP